MIRIQDLEFGYESSLSTQKKGQATFPHRFLAIPDLTIHAGEKIALIGRSGAGKTSLLALISGSLVPQRGTVFIDDVPLSNLSESARREFRIAQIGWVFQDFELVDYLSVRENILLPFLLNPAISLTSEVQQRLTSLTRTAGIHHLLQRFPIEVSQGERQRVAVCRALITRPSLILADEPTGSLDARTGQDILQLLIQQATLNKATLLMVSHDPASFGLFTRTIKLDDYSSSVEGSSSTNSATPTDKEDASGTERSAPPIARRPARSLGLVPSSVILARRYLSYYQSRSWILVSAIALTVFLPLVTRGMIARFERLALHRAKTTPLIIGAKGSRFGLAIHSLYFRGETPATTKHGEVERVEGRELAQVIPLFVKFRARGYPIVGTTAAYINHRQLRLQEGAPLQRLGDCLVGATLAKNLKVGPGDRLLSDPDNLFDLAGPSPLNLRVMGVLSPTETSDDDIVLCDLETTWIMEGIGHGHAASKVEGGSVEHAHRAGRELLQPYAEVTDENLSSFHFHGRSSDYPLTALIAIPRSAKSEAILLGEYLSVDQPLQAIRPQEVIEEILQVVSRVRRYFDAAALLLSIATGMLLALVLALSLRMRQRELRTLFLLGCARGRVAQIVGAELVIVLGVGSLLAMVMALVATRYSDSLFYHFMQ